MSTNKYTEKQAKEDAVAIWQAIYDKVEQKEMTDDFIKSLPISGFHAIKELIYDGYPQYRHLQNSCSYCQNVLSPSGRLDCYDCIGFKNNAFGKGKSCNLSCNNPNSSYSKMVQFVVDSGDIAMIPNGYEKTRSVKAFKKKLLEQIKYHLDEFTRIRDIKDD